MNIKEAHDWLKSNQNRRVWIKRNFWGDLNNPLFKQQLSYTYETFIKDDVLMSEIQSGSYKELKADFQIID